MNKKVSLSIIAAILFFSACNHNQEKEVDAVITSFYNKPTQDHNKADTALLTKGLAGLLSEAIDKEHSSAEAIKQSAEPTDKPDLIEGDIFTSLYEGPSSPAHVEKLEFQGDSAVATVSFTNEMYKTGWKDKIVLRKENSWKIDNVIFMGKDAAGTSTRQVLEAFLSRP